MLVKIKRKPPAKMKLFTSDFSQSTAYAIFYEFEFTITREKEQ